MSENAVEGKLETLATALVYTCSFPIVFFVIHCGILRSGGATWTTCLGNRLDVQRVYNTGEMAVDKCLTLCSAGRWPYRYAGIAGVQGHLCYPGNNMNT